MPSQLVLMPVRQWVCEGQSKVVTGGFGRSSPEEDTQLSLRGKVGEGEGEAERKDTDFGLKRIGFEVWEMLDLKLCEEMHESFDFRSFGFDGFL